ncbi:uncharacterized protein LOC119444275 [Dermacentor silvarum]|uniref:uncharacterized protein LOC119444275 n=1 Tax=Dermacentor silvarum TaxID=543639 RepID=UPI001899D056|nr:uncharacterized protein LOC119444275 [Dermacentor silvarum]
MVERLHRQLKAALIARNAQTSWVDELPLVMLGIRSAIKEDLGCTAAEMVYGTSLRLPGEFFDPAPAPDLSPPDYIEWLRHLCQRLQPTPARQPSNYDVFVSRDLASSSHVFVRRKDIRTSLTAPYESPFKVLGRTDKTFTLRVNGRTDVVAIDRVKPAYMPNSSVSVSLPES